MFLAINEASSAARRWFVCGAASSYVWDHPRWSSLKFKDLTFAGSAYGSGRPNMFRVRGGSDDLLHLRALCPKDHKHLPWNWSSPDAKRTDADKASLAPPKAFLKRVAESFAAVGSSPPPMSGEAAAVLTFAKAAAPFVDANKERVAKLSSAAAWQARGRRLDQLISEYKRIDKACIPASICGQ